MATPPIAPPFYMTKTGAPDILVTSLDGDGGAAQYTAALGMGYSYSSTTTTEVSVNPSQPDPNQPVEPS